MGTQSYAQTGLPAPKREAMSAWDVFMQTNSKAKAAPVTKLKLHAQVPRGMFWVLGSGFWARSIHTVD